MTRKRQIGSIATEFIRGAPDVSRSIVWHRSVEGSGLRVLRGGGGNAVTARSALLSRRMGLAVSRNRVTGGSSSHPQSETDDVKLDARRRGRRHPSPWRKCCSPCYRGYRRCSLTIRDIEATTVLVVVDAVHQTRATTPVTSLPYRGVLHCITFCVHGAPWKVDLPCLAGWRGPIETHSPDALFFAPGAIRERKQE